MKIKNQTAFRQGVKDGRDGYGPIFEQILKKLAEDLEVKIEKGEKLTAKLVKEENERILTKELKLFMTAKFQNEIFTTLARSWEYGDLIEVWLNRKKL